MRWRLKILLIVVFCVLLLGIVLTRGISLVSTDKDSYSAGEDVVVSYSDFRLLRSNQGPVINFYWQGPDEWEKITYAGYHFSFGNDYCVDGKLIEGSFPADVGRWAFFDRPFLSRSYTWKPKIYELKKEKEICGEPKVFREIAQVQQPVFSYQTKPASAGMYKVTFGNTERIFKIE